MTDMSSQNSQCTPEFSCFFGRSWLKTATVTTNRNALYTELMFVTRNTIDLDLLEIDLFSFLIAYSRISTDVQVMFSRNYHYL